MKHSQPSPAEQAVLDADARGTQLVVLACSLLSLCAVAMAVALICL